MENGNVVVWVVMTIIVFLLAVRFWPSRRSGGGNESGLSTRLTMLVPKPDDDRGYNVQQRVPAQTDEQKALKEGARAYPEHFSNQELINLFWNEPEFLTGVLSNRELDDLSFEVLFSLKTNGVIDEDQYFKTLRTQRRRSR